MSASGPISSSRSGDLDQRFALDVQGVDALRRTTRNSPQDGLKQVSRQFEAMFMQMVLKSMREATPSDGMFDSQQEKMYTSMLDQQLAQNLSGRGLGLAEAMQAQLSRAVDQSRQLPAPLGKLPPSAVDQNPGQPAAAAAASAIPGSVQNLSLYDAASGSGRNAGSGSGPQAYVDQFLSRMTAPAQAASRASGVPSQLILAQAALESGWGKREIKGADGSSSHNLFGIKAGKGWKGPVVQAVTTEYVDGLPQQTTAPFRAYASYEEAFSDYARFLAGNPRYAQVLATRDPAEAAHGLQRAGYATDPQYGEKLARILKQIL
ncbi:flagellar rod assembly protein/muramidase FlgJ [Collimonas fungivorans]|jgi:flagellar protein FlgJ|uniref:Peptidoglycan hydrolase FlgJ n=1 Tax=Collimonas fungivorans TaxID=158899 RepID=A0A127P854_9BURK|nr:flagellar assembly peptidoglycan hydrolase FlgJ [Collimonas fungivorans]AMO93938.1 flagellar rod assembly protein/muramidase FlgJ [Collimonas fungivorans]